MGEENEKLKGKKHVKRGKKEKQVNVEKATGKGARFL